MINLVSVNVESEWDGFDTFDTNIKTLTSIPIFHYLLVRRQNS